VRFAYKGNPAYATENTATYDLAGNDSWTPTLGTQSLTATPFSASNASGSAGTSLTISFSVTESGSTSPASTICQGTGGITREYWGNVSGDFIGSIPVNNTPTSRSQLSSFEVPSNVADNYGQRVRGYICAPVSGNYTFYIAGDNNAELWLSTDGNTANRRRIASVTGWTNPREWTKYSSQRSASVYLQQGTRYYIEVLHKESTGGDNMAVGWTAPNSSTIAVIPGANLIPFSATNARLSTQEEDLQRQTTMTAYPNPFEDKLFLQTPTQGEWQISLIDALGRICYSAKHIVRESELEIDLSQTDLKNGVYFIKAQCTGNKDIILRVVKL
jgi:hypothetical protein